MTLAILITLIVLTIVTVARFYKVLTCSIKNLTENVSYLNKKLEENADRMSHQEKVIQELKNASNPNNKTASED